jgi:hypothetical protein
MIYDRLFLRERKRNIPRVSNGRPWVRARFDAVEIPLNRMKKSRNARKNPLLLPVAIGKIPADQVAILPFYLKPEGGGRFN